MAGWGLGGCRVPSLSSIPIPGSWSPVTILAQNLKWLKDLPNVDADLLEAWRTAASHPDDHIAKWMGSGAPAGILNPIPDPGIFPTCTKPATSEPLDLHSDADKFQNYANVEASEVTEAELSSHWEKGHIIGFDSYDELFEFVRGKPILSKFGLILKTRNGVTKARLILDTKESGIKLATGQWHRIVLPRLFDAILQLLALLAMLPGGASKDALSAAVEAFVLDFSDAYYQIPLDKPRCGSSAPPASSVESVCGLLSDVPLRAVQPLDNSGVA